jgi:hypothetical protein
MALPKLTTYPTYDLVIPSTGKKAQYRPFLVAEQKILLMALETKDQSQVMNAITQVIQNCIVSDLNIRSLTTFDIEYIFLQLRSKSVGERANITMLCGSCNLPNVLTINLNDVRVEVPKGPLPTVKITDQYTLKLRYPKYSALLYNEAVKHEETLANAIYEQALACLDSLITDDEVIKFDDEARQEVETFMASLLTTQLKPVMDFAMSIPSVAHPADFKCTSCGRDNKYTLKGISDFF